MTVAAYHAQTSLSWDRIMLELDTTFRRWGVSSWHVSPRKEPPRRADQMVRIAFTHPVRGRVAVETSAHGNARWNLRVLSLSLEDVRMVEKRGGLELFGSVVAQLTALPAHSLPPAALAAYRTLGLTGAEDPEQVRVRYRELALQHHPDRGGDAGRMKEIAAAYDELRRVGAVV